MDGGAEHRHTRHSRVCGGLSSFQKKKGHGKLLKPDTVQQISFLDFLDFVNFRNQESGIEFK